MNTATFNDPFAAMIRNLYGESTWRKWAVSPLFFYDALDASRKIIESFEESEGVSVSGRLPFNEFRVCFDIKDSTDVNCFVRNLDGERLEIIYDGKRHGHHPDRSLEMVRLVVAPGWKTVIEWGIYSREGRQFTDNIDAAKEAILRSAKDLSARLTCLAIDALRPTNYLARIRPSKEGKSVEWIEARTHYVYIKHDDPRNAISLSANGNGDGKPMPRMAHARRSHFKTLRSPRFRWKMGQRVFVKAAWVGPKEWEDKGGRQIYQILELAE